MDQGAENIRNEDVEEFDVDGFLQLETPEEHDRRIKNLFNSLDKDHSGSIDIGEFQEYYEKLSGKHDHDDHLYVGFSTEQNKELSEEIMDQCDSDGNHQVDLKEFTDFVMYKERELWGLFHSLDTSGDNRVDMEELKQALQAEGDISYAEREQFIQRVLKDRKEITWQEFLDYFLLNPRASEDMAGAYNFYKDAFRMGFSVFGLDSVMLPPEAARAEELQSQIVGAYTLATALSRTVSAPLDRLRIFFQLGGSSNVRRLNRHRANKAQALPPKGLQILSHEGRVYMKRIVKRAVKQISTDGGLIKGLWKGNTLNVAKLLPESAIRVVSMGLARVYIAHKEGAEDLISISNKGLFEATAISGLASQVAIQPLDTIRTQMMSGIERLSEDTGVDALKDHNQQAPKLRRLIPKPHRANNVGIAKSASPFNSETSRPFSTHTPFSNHPNHAKKEAVPKPPKDLTKNRSYTALGVTKHIWNQQGFRGYYRGLLPALASVVPFTAINDGVYEIFENRWFDRHETDDGYLPPTIPRVMLMGLISMTCAQLTVYPLSVIQSRMMAQGTPLHPYTYNNSWDCIMQTYSRNGLAGFWRGVSFAVIKTIPSVGLLFGLYEYGKRHWFDLSWNPGLGIWENSTANSKVN